MLLMRNDRDFYCFFECNSKNSIILVWTPLVGLKFMISTTGISKFSHGSLSSPGSEAPSLQPNSIETGKTTTALATQTSSHHYTRDK